MGESNEPDGISGPLKIIEEVNFEKRESHEEFRDLTRGVIAAPNDDAPRLVLADWFEEHDGILMADFIRRQVDYPQPSEAIVVVGQKISLQLEPGRELAFHFPAWMERIAVRFVRGMIEEVRLDLKVWWSATSMNLMNSFPIRRVELEIDQETARSEKWADRISSLAEGWPGIEFSLPQNYNRRRGYRFE